MNVLTLIGRLTADVELRYTNTGTAVAQFTLAVDRQRKVEGQPDVDFVPIVVWGKLGELCAQYLKKGKMAAANGRLQLRSYQNSEGVNVRVAECVAENVKFLSPADGSQNGSNNSGSQSYGQGGQNGYNGQGGGFGGGFGGGYGAGGGFGGGANPFADDGKPIDISDDDLPF